MKIVGCILVVAVAVAACIVCYRAGFSNGVADAQAVAARDNAARPPMIVPPGVTAEDSARMARAKADADRATESLRREVRESEQPSRAIEVFNMAGS